MMRQKMYAIGLMAILAVALVSTSYGAAVKVGDFEGMLDGWRAGDGMTIAFGTTGATVGTQAMQVTGPGNWHIAALLDAKSHRATLSNKGVKITADVTAFAADMTTGWMQVEMVINAQNSGTNNNVGWNGLGGQDVIRDGQPHTYTWTLPDTLTAKIAGADDNISWFELALISNLDAASVTKFYVDNIQISYEAPSASILVGNFEGNLDNWYKDTATLSLSTTGATLGTQAMQVDNAGGWKLGVKLDVKPYRTALANKGVKITADVTAFTADMTTTWMQVGMVINATNNNDSGANNNLGWNDLGLQNVTRDGQPHTLTWVLSDALTAKIAGADDNISWFEFALISNVDGASVAKFYIDNIQIVGIPLPTGKSTDFILGNWEQKMDGWVGGGGADVRYNDHNGVTLDKYSLDIYTPTGAWAAVLTMNLLDPNNAAALAAFRANTKITADITHLVADWPTDAIPPWNGTHFVINTDTSAVNTTEDDGYMDLGYKAGWSQGNGDRTDPVTWDYSKQISWIDFSKVTYLELQVIVNANSADYTGWVLFYLDNMKLSGGGIAMNPKPANGAKDVNTDTKLSWTAGAFAKSHNVYFGTSSASVSGANLDSDPTVTFAKVDGTTFDPGALAFNTQYFWRVDAVNDVSPDSPWKAGVWNFTTGNFLVVDDFESYTNDSPNRVFQTWVDGFGFSADEFFPKDNPGNGSDAGVGHDIWTPGTVYTNIVETATVHGGSQAMPLYYDNKTKGYSEAIRTWAQPQNWKINGFDAFTIFVYGSSTNVPDPLYVTVEDSAGKAVTVPLDSGAVMTTASWTDLTVKLTDFADVNLASVKKMTIGVGSKATVSKAAGMLLIDDVRIGFKPKGLVAHYKLDGDLKDSSGNGYNGTLVGDPNFPVKYVAGPTGFGQAMLFDGTSGHQAVELGTFNPSAATGKLTVAMWAKWDGLTGQYQGLIGKRDGWDVAEMLWDIEASRDTGAIGFRRIDSYPDCGGQILPIGVWTHIAATFDGTTVKFYINGVQSGNGGNFSFGQKRDASLHFGCNDPNGGNPFNGALDDVRLYDTALSVDEIKKLAGK